MFTFNSPIIKENIWKICFKTKNELIKLYYEDEEIEREEDIRGLIEYATSTIYIDKNLDDVLLKRTLRKKMMNLYLWETGQQNRLYTEEEFCDITSVAAPLICKSADELVLGLKKYIKSKKGDS